MAFRALATSRTVARAVQQSRGYKVAVIGAAGGIGQPCGRAPNILFYWMLALPLASLFNSREPRPHCACWLAWRGHFARLPLR